MLDIRWDVFDLWVKGFQVNQWLSKLLQLDLANLACFNKNPILLNGVLCIMEKHVHSLTRNQHFYLIKLLVTPRHCPGDQMRLLESELFDTIALELCSMTLGELASGSELCKARIRLRSFVWKKALPSVMLYSCHFLKKYSELNFYVFNTDTLKQ